MVGLAVGATRERLCLITDRMETPDGAPDFGAGRVRDDGSAWRLADGTLAASTLSMNRALKNAVAMVGMDRLEAVAACTLRPATLLGLEAERGTLRAGARADLVLLDDANEVVETWLGGEPVWEASGEPVGEASG